jgi:hypothetical protein
MHSSEFQETRTATTLPAHALGADLIWWRTADGMRTTASILWAECQAFPDQVHLQALLFDADGVVVASWKIPLIPGKPTFVDSAADGPWRRHAGKDGLLALYACTSSEPSALARENYNRLFPIVDWRAADGRVVTLHSDQVVQRGRQRLQRLTEIVVVESDAEKNSLVFLNGEDLQAANALEIFVKNSGGATLSAKYPVAMQPFTVHRIPLASLFPDLVSFSAGHALLVSATFASIGLFSRPYVETTGVRWGAYHAGNVYAWTALPYIAHALISGEVNPVAVIHDDKTRTYVNLLHSHGDVEDDMWVNALLFDAEGVCVADRSPWRQVPRHGLERFDVADLLPDPAVPFRGHIALSFAARHGQAVPRHLQALLEYRNEHSVARTMAWSDEWNSNVRVAKRDRMATPLIGKSCFRIWEDVGLGTEIAITNAGHAGYQRDANVRLVLHGADGPVMETELRLAPFATHMAKVEQLFPGARAALAPSGLGMLLIESSSDLANLAFTRHRQTGAIAAEHFMAMPTEHEGSVEWPPGN